MRARVRRDPRHVRARLRGPRLGDAYRRRRRHGVRRQRVRVLRRVRADVPDRRARRERASARKRRSTRPSRRRAPTAASGARSTSTCAAMPSSPSIPPTTALERGPHVRQGTVRAPVRARERPAHLSDDAPHRRDVARSELGRGDDLRAPARSGASERSTAPTPSAAISSSRCTNEENYVLQKLFRAAIGTNNIDNCSRVCHSPTSLGLIRSLGESGGTNSFADIDMTACLLLTGRQPHRRSPRRRRAHEGGRAPRRQAHRDRSAAHRARGDGGRPPPAQAGLERRRLQRPRARDLPRRARGRDVHRRPLRGLGELPDLHREVRRRSSSRRSAACPRRTSSAPRTSTRSRRPR